MIVNDYNSNKMLNCLLYYKALWLRERRPLAFRLPRLSLSTADVEDGTGAMGGQPYLAAKHAIQIKQGGPHVGIS